jgi:hypothetical protein
LPTIEETAQRLAHILSGGADLLSDPNGSDLQFFTEIDIQPLPALPPPQQCWAVDGGQALVADARCLQVVATRAARTLWSDGHCTVEEEGELTVHLLAGAGGGPEGRQALAELGSPVASDAPVDLNLLRDWSEWRLVAQCVQESPPGSIVLVDGDLEPDWRVPAWWLAELVSKAGERAVNLVGVTKHSSLARGGAPLVGYLEREADRVLGRRARWWAPVAIRRDEVGAGLLVSVAKLDPDARFAFRFDAPHNAPVRDLLGQLCSLSDDAAFPGYPYPLSVADRLASCSGWARQEVWGQLDSALAAAGVPAEVKERAFADRHNFMERG